MTPTQLRTTLAALLSDLLGTYKEGSSARGAAIVVGEPPPDYRASGLECRIGGHPDFTNTPLQGSESNLAETHLVRLVQRGSPSKLTAATRRVVRQFADATVTRVDGSENLGILDQVVIRIPN